MFGQREKMNKKLLEAIVANGDEYCRSYLREYDTHALASDWWQAFDFFLAHACFQGRRDEVSNRVYKNARAVLYPLFSDKQRDQNYEAQKKTKWKDVNSGLYGRIGKGKVGKARDVKMILSALSYIDRLDDRNIVANSVAQIRSKNLQQHYAKLQARNGNQGIIQIGPKIAAFYLRDVVSVFQLSDFVGNQSAFCLQAVDTWVCKVAEKLGIVGDDAATSKVQGAIVSMCEEHEISALRFNQGAWFTGYHAFDLLLDLLSK